MLGGSWCVGFVSELLLAWRAPAHMAHLQAAAGWAADWADGARSHTSWTSAAPKLS